MKLEHKLLDITSSQVKAAGVAGHFEGWASKYGNVDSYGDMIMPGAYSESLASGRKVAMYWSHQQRLQDMPAKIGTSLR